jgi:group I intron endonuclease
MISKQIPGVYMILNVYTNARYVGGTTKPISRRFSEHRCYLKKHRQYVNPLLQSAWDEYGQDAFVFIPLENTDPSLVHEREQYWMDKFRDAGYELYNRCPNAENNSGLVMPENVGKIASSVNRARWAKMSEEERHKFSEAMKDRNADPEYQQKIKQGRIDYWAKIYFERGPIIFINPNNEKFAVMNVHRFCLVNNLDPSAMTKVISGKRPSHKGWRKA